MRIPEKVLPAHTGSVFYDFEGASCRAARHCEQTLGLRGNLTTRDCFASLAMTLYVS